MKRWLIFFLPLLYTACQQFPSNPPKNIEPPTVFIEHLKTDYIEFETSIDGLATDKVNILFFQLKVANFEAKALEFYGRADIEGPPEMVNHAIHFRTDLIGSDLDGTNYPFVILDDIQPESTYAFLRPKFPTNEYSPFSGTQGMIRSITITEVWAYDEHGNKFLVELGQST